MADGSKRAPEQGVRYWLLKHGGFTVTVSLGLLFLLAFGLIKATGFRQHHAPVAAVTYTDLPGAADTPAAAVPQTSVAAVVAPPPATSAAASPAQMLADLDDDKQPAGDYQAALDALGPKCTQDEAHIAGLGDAGYRDLVKNGVSDETRLSVLQHLDASIPSSMGRTDCAGMLSAYLVLREG